MGASSVTGKGAGSSESVNKGASGRQTLGVSHLIGPYIGAANSVQCVSGSKVVQLPKLNDNNTEWVVLVTNTDATSPAATSASAVDADWKFTVYANGSDVVNYMVVYKGIGL
jgi:hypothetical protein